MRTPMVLVGLLLLLAVPSYGVAKKAKDPYAFQTFKAADGTKVEYLLLLPLDYDASKAYPALLALPPGGQDRDMAAAVVRPWDKALMKGWIVLAPVAPRGRMFTGEASALLPELMDAVQSKHRIAEKRWHLFGISNGGRSAFTVAMAHRERFVSMTVLPGVPPDPEDSEALSVLKTLPVTLAVGSEDAGWTTGAIRTHQTLSAAGGNVSIEILDGAGHSAFRDVPWATLEKWLLRR